jgi:hypothetical protein
MLDSGRGLRIILKILCGAAGRPMMLQNAASRGILEIQILHESFRLKIVATGFPDTSYDERG